MTHPPQHGPRPGEPFPGEPSTTGPPPAGRALVPVAGLAVAVRVLAVVVTVLQGLVVLVGVTLDAREVPSGYGSLQDLASLAWLAAFVVTSVWLLRARRNAEALAPSFHHVRRRGWACAGWVVPVVGFWFPYQVVRDVLTASAEADPGRLRRPPLGLWWATWLVGSVLGNGRGSGTFLGAGTPVHDGANLLGAAALVVSLVLWLRVVRTLTALQARAG